MHKVENVLDRLRNGEAIAFDIDPLRKEALVQGLDAILKSYHLYLDHIEAETLAGLMLELKRDFPRKGDVFTSHDLRFTVQEMDGHRVDKIRVDLQ